MNYTKEDFLNGVPFYHKDEYVRLKRDVEIGCIVRIYKNQKFTPHYCTIGDITDKGFYFGSSIFGHTLRAFIKFTDLKKAE